MLREFEFTALPWRIIFGVGSIGRLPPLLDDLGFRRALILATPEQGGDAERIAALLGGAAAGIFAEAVMHVPSATVARARAQAGRLNADCSVSIGGGSTTGLGKALRLEDDLPQIAVPTTYAGSEMTNIWGVTEGERKRTGRDARVVPIASIYDPELTLGLPAGIAGPSGINALAQAVVNVCTEAENPIVALMAEEAIRALSRSLRRVVKQPDDLEARSEALYGACLAGAALGTGTTGLHHRLCHVLGGTFNTPHAETHAVLLPHTVCYNAAAVPAGTARVASALGVDDAAQGIYDLAGAVGAKVALSELGLREDDLDRAAALTTERPFSNPAQVTREGVRALLEAAFHGLPPSR